MNVTIKLELRCNSESLQDIEKAIVNALSLSPTVGEILMFSFCSPTSVGGSPDLDRDPDFHHNPGCSEVA